MEKICANAVCWVTPSELGIPEISAPSHHSLSEKKGKYFRNTPLPGYYPTQTNFVPKSQVKERKGHQKFNNMKKLASNQGGYITF
jgi:hypothetical protein